jgi:hypothetical protein
MLDGAVCIRLGEMVCGLALELDKFAELVRGELELGLDEGAGDEVGAFLVDPTKPNKLKNPLQEEGQFLDMSAATHCHDERLCL